MGYKAVQFVFIGGVLNQEGKKFRLQYSDEMPVYSTSDFNNDGKGDIFFMEKGHSSNNYPCAIMELNNTVLFTLNLPSKPEKLFVSDYNGDGLNDILVFYNGGYTIFWNKGNGISTSTFSNSYKTTGTNIGNVWKIWPGDFNGDGLMDFLMNATGSNQWHFALNSGNGTFVKQLACTLDIYDQDFTDYDDSRFNAQVFDFDGDGKSDVIITKAMYDKKQEKILGIVISTWGELNKTRTYWMRSTGSSLTQVSSATSKRSSDALDSKYVLGDFNGDGQPELMNFGYNCYNAVDADADASWKIYANSNFDVSKGKVTSITDGLGSTTAITYASLANGDIYTKGTGSTYPVADYAPPLHAVKTVTENNGAAGSVTVNYQYKGLKAHLQGKGLLGMSSQTVTNTTLGTTTESGVSAWNTSFYIPSQTFAKSTVDGKTAETSTTLTIVDKGSKKYFAYPSSQTDKDLDGNTATTTNQYNSDYGYITETKTEYGSSGMYKKTQYGDYVLAGNVYKPRLITLTQKHSDDASTFTQKTYITYNTAKGYREQVIENYQTSLPLTTDITYDAFGNVKTSKSTGSGVIQLIHNTDYDATNRFTVKTYTSPASFVNTYTHDAWGNVLTEKDEKNPANILTTTYSYDSWGNLTAAISPEGLKTTIRKGWNNKPEKRFFTLTQGTGQPWVKTWYDNKGREVLTETVGAMSMNVRQATAYNNKGLVTSKQTTTGNLTATDTYTYDGRGRVSTQSSSAGQVVSYTYGNRSVTSVSNGRTTTKTFDAWGGIQSVTDPASSISYTYKSLGKPQSISTGGATYSMTYNNTGTQLTLIDPNAGTITFNTYDALGRLRKQTDAKGKITESEYDALGRLTVSKIDGVQTSYTYGASGNDLLRLTKEQTGNNYASYAYDGYGRVLTEKRQIDGSGLLEFGYHYNTKGQPDYITYPGGLQIDRQYDTYGNLNKVSAGAQTLWELTGNTGTVTATQLGSALTATETRNSQGLLTNLKMLKGSSVLHSMDYVFNGATGNLTSRTGMTGQTESFLYDDVDRLTTVQQGSATTMSIGYDPNGNIHSKSGLGEYKYENTPHAVSFVENTDGLIPWENQEIGYTAFNKVSSVSEKIGTDNYLLDITYGPDRQRWKTLLKKNNVLQKTIIFAGDYEAITENGVTRQLYYIPGGNGLAAVYVKQSGQTDKIYYAFADHLGSIVKLFDGNGATVFAANYDAWGNRTVTNNSFAFHRGYTGHEHLPEFNLVDMNGRMYDPVLGRFLSPDPFVQAPEFSQSFNRYAYCINNPLRYTDPSGEVFGIDDAILIAAFAYIGGMQANWAYSARQGTNPFNPGNWNWNSAHTYIGIVGGAISGVTMAGYTIPYTQVPGMIPNGLLQGGIQVGLNGIGNLTDGRNFFDNWYWSAGMGFVSGAVSGYGLAKEKGLNYWWGNKNAYNRTSWSFFNTDKPDYVIDFGIPNVGSKADNDCVPTTFAEIESKRGGSRTYENFENIPGYEKGKGTTISGERYRNLMRENFNSQLFDGSNANNLFDPAYMQSAADNGEIFSFHFAKGTEGHADNVRKLQVYLRDPMRNTLQFRQSNYNFNQYKGWSNIKSIFRIF